MISVIGGTGLVGRTVVNQLVAAGETVRVCSRSRSPSTPEVVEWMPIDVRDADSVRRAIADSDAVVYTVATLRESKTETYQDVNVRGTDNLIAGMHAAGVSRLIYMSALGTVNDPRFRYIQSRWQGERAILGSGLAYTILKPSLLVGESFGIFDRLVQAIRMTPPPFILLPDGGRTRFQPMWVEDLARCIVQSLQDPQRAEQSYELGGPEYWTFRDMMALTIRLRGAKRIMVGLPRQLMVPSVIGMGLALKDPPVTLTELKQLVNDNTTALDAVERQFGFSPDRIEDHLAYVRDL